MDWGLEAVVSGATYYNPTSHGTVDGAVECNGWFELRVDDYEYQYSPPTSFSFGDDFLDGAKVFDDLEEVYKPFYPGFQCHSSSAPIQEVQGFECREESATTSPVAVADDALLTKYKRRKNQQKRVVEHVTTDGVSSDKWAWRKYGQKPIKGSPFPRSYYRCSSSRGCLARKQVERSTSDPNAFILSYTGDHNHEQPTRRNALAGSTRSKFSRSATNNKINSPGASVDAGGFQVESPISSSGVNSPAYSGRESEDGKLVNNLSSGGGFGDQEIFLGFEEMGYWKDDHIWRSTAC